jgi:hypothetical protein
MTTSLLVLLRFAYDVFRRLIRDAYYRALGSAVLLMLLIGTLFLWLSEGRTFLQAVTYSAMTMAMNSPWCTGAHAAAMGFQTPHPHTVLPNYRN